MSSSLPRGSGRSASRCPAPARDERPSGVGASAPAGRRSPPRPAPLTLENLPQPPLFHQRTALPTRREKRPSLADSVHCAGEALSIRGKRPRGEGRPCRMTCASPLPFPHPVGDLPPRPGSLGWWVFSRPMLRPAGCVFSSPAPSFRHSALTQQRKAVFPNPQQGTTYRLRSGNDGSIC